VQEIDGPLSVGGCLKDGAIILLKHSEPMAEVSRVVVAGFRRDAEVATEEGGSDFGDQFFTGVTLVAEFPVSEIPVEAGRVFRPVRLMPKSA
jgi:hypothetical protein